MSSVYLKNFLPVEDSPWRFSPEPFLPRKIVELQVSDPEYNDTSIYFMAGKPTETCIIRIICIYNRFSNAGFLAYLCIKEPLSKERVCNLALHKDLSQSYFPLKFKVQQNHAKLLPVWHGTSLQEDQLMGEWREIIIFQKVEPFPSLTLEVGEDLLQLQQAGHQFKDVEGFYCNQLLQAKKDKIYQEQLFYLEKISDLYLQKHNWVQAAKLLNSALAILQKNSDNLQLQYFVSKLERIEALFLENNGHQAPACTGTVLKYRESLKSARAICLNKYREGKPIQLVVRFLTGYYKKLLGTLVLDSQKILGPPPVDWACIGMGSMARDEMCPYSDSEFAFLIDQKTDTNLNYFRTLSKLLELKIINLGETALPLFGKLFGEKSAQASPTPSGFSMDSGGNTPLGKPGFYELIDTPEGLSQFQSENWIESDIIVTNALSSVCYIAGDKSLFIKYNEAKKKQQAKLNESRTPFHKKLALKLLEAHVQDFKPCLSKEKQEVGAFGIKQELYRPFQTFLGGLSLFSGISGPSSFKVIEHLLDHKLLSSAGAKNLAQALNKVLQLRFEAHTFYQNEGEFLLHVEAGKSQDPQFLYLDEKKIESLHEIYRVLIPFHVCALEFLRTKDLKVFARASFYDDNPTVKGDTFEKALQYLKAHEARQQAVSLNPNDIHALTALGHTEMDMAKYQEAVERNLKALNVLLETCGENDAAVASVCSNLGQGYLELGNHDKALEYHKRSLKIWLNVLKGDHPVNGPIYHDIKPSQKKPKQYGNLEALDLNAPISSDESSEESQNYKVIMYNNAEDFMRALKVDNQLHKEKCLSVATTYNNIASTYSQMGKQQLALEHYQKALKIQIESFGEHTLNVATSYSNLGVFLFESNQLNAALAYYNKALQIRYAILGADHPEVAILYNNIGCAHHPQNLEKAFEYHKKALVIFEKVYGKNHVDTALTYIHIADYFRDKKLFAKAEPHYHLSLKIFTNLLGKKHPSVAKTQHKLGFFYFCVKKYDLAVKHLEANLEIQLQNPNSNPLATALNCYEIGDCYLSLKDYPRALQHYEKGMHMRIQVLGNTHPKVVESYKTVGMLYSMLGNETKMDEYFTLAHICENASGKG